MSVFTNVRNRGFLKQNVIILCSIAKRLLRRTESERSEHFVRRNDMTCVMSVENRWSELCFSSKKNEREAACESDEWRRGGTCRRFSCATP